MNSKQHQNRPLNFSLDIEEQENEMFITLPKELTEGLHYEVSNLGRVRSHVTSVTKIILSYKVHDRGNFFVKLSGKQYRIKDLVFIAFFGEIKEDHLIKCIDGNPFNLNIKNLKQEPKPPKKKKKEPKRRYNEPVINRAAAQPVKPPKPKTLQVKLTKKYKKEQILEMKKLKKEGYILASFDNNIYKFRLKDTLCHS